MSKKEGTGAPLVDPEIERIAGEIGTAGQNGDAVLGSLAEGLNKAVSTLSEMGLGLLSLAKAKKSDDDEEEDDDTEEEEGGDDDPAGYEQMAMGRESAPGERVIDATQFILQTASRIDTLEKAQKKQTRLISELSAQNERLLQQNEQLGRMVQQGAQATVSLIAPLAKAVSEQRTSLLDTPAKAITPPSRPKAPPAANGGYIGGSERRETQALAKAFSTGVIDADMKTLYRQERKFSHDQSIDVAKRAELAAIAASFNT